MYVYCLYAFLTEALAAAISPYLQIMLRNKGYSHSLVGVIIAVSQIAGLFFPLINGAKIDRNGRYKTRLFLYVIILLVCFAIFVSPHLNFGMQDGKQGTLAVMLYAAVFTLGVGCYSVLNPAMDSYMTANLKGDSDKYGKIRACGTAGYVALLVLVALIGFPSETSNYEIFLTILISAGLFLFSLFLLPAFQGGGDGSHRICRAAEKNASGAVEGENDLSEADSSRFVVVEGENDSAGTDSSKKRRGLFKKNSEFGIKENVSWIQKPFFIFMLIFTIYRMGMSIVEMMLGSYMTEVLHLGQNFTLFVALASFSEIFSLVIAGALIKKGRVSAWTLLFISCVAMVLRLLIYAFTSSAIMFSISQCLHAFTFGTAHIAATSFIAGNVDKKDMSKAMALYWAFSNNFTQFAGPLFGGVIIDKLGYSSLFILYAVFPLISCILCFKYKNLLLGKERV